MSCTCQVDHVHLFELSCLSHQLSTVCPAAGSTFELVAVATSRVGVIPQVLAEESDLQSITLQQPAAGIPLNACTLPGVLSMQVVLEETAAAADTDAASGAGATTEEADLTQPAG